VRPSRRRNIRRVIAHIDEVANCESETFSTRRFDLVRPTPECCAIQKMGRRRFIPLLRWQWCEHSELNRPVMAKLQQLSRLLIGFQLLFARARKFHLSAAFA
jgi:hypothetical protein